MPEPGPSYPPDAAASPPSPSSGVAGPVPDISAFGPSSTARAAEASASGVSGNPIELTPEPFTLTAEPPDDPEASPRSPIRRVFLIAVLVIAVGAAAVLGYTAWQILSQRNATLTTPPQIGSLRLDDSQDGKDTADYLQTALAAELDLNHPVGAIYKDGAGRDVLFFGGTGLIWSPGKDLDNAFATIADDQGAVTGIQDVSPGKLGGTMRCGTTKTDAGNIPVCGWADHGALAVAMFTNRSEQDSAQLLQQIRNATQSRP